MKGSSAGGQTPSGSQKWFDPFSNQQECITFTLSNWTGGLMAQNQVKSAHCLRVKYVLTTRTLHIKNTSTTCEKLTCKQHNDNTMTIRKQCVFYVLLTCCLHVCVYDPAGFP